MASITIQFDDQKKISKKLIEAIKKVLQKTGNEGEIVVNEIEESPYDPKFVEKIKKAEKRASYTEIDPKDVWGSLGLK